MEGTGVSMERSWTLDGRDAVACMDWDGRLFQNTRKLGGGVEKEIKAKTDSKRGAFRFRARRLHYFQTWRLWVGSRMIMDSGEWDMHYFQGLFLSSAKTLD